jgi:hypothetical protein
MKPDSDFVVASITSPSSGLRRLTLADGYARTGVNNLSSVSVGDLLSLEQLRDYAPSLTDADRMLCSIVAVNVGSGSPATGGTIDIKLPTGARLDTSATLTQTTYFPVWHAAKSGLGLNGFTWTIKTKYWMPWGMNFSANWLWLYIVHRLEAAIADTGQQTYDISYRTPVSAPYITDTVAYTDNSDGHWQLYHALRTGNQNNQGQAIKLILSGTQIASRLVLQFLEAHATEETGNVLKQFEG